MNCHDARRQFSAVLDGNAGLTEWAQVEAHVNDCTDCADLLEELYQLRPRHDPDRGRSSAGSVDVSLDSSAADELILLPRRRRLQPVLRSLIVGTAVVTLGVGTGLAFSIYRWSPERLIIGLTAVPRPAVPGVRPVESSRQMAPEGKSEVDQVHAAASGESQATSEVPEANISAEPAPSLPSPSRPQAPKGDGDPDRARQTRAAVSKSVPASGIALPPRKSAAMAPPANADSASEATSSASSDIIVRLSVQDRGEAERDVTMLLTRVGGTKLGRDKGFTLSVAVPRTSYGEFTRGLAQIGSWQTEILRSSLPDPVRVAVKLAK